MTADGNERIPRNNQMTSLKRLVLTTVSFGALVGLAVTTAPHVLAQGTQQRAQHGAENSGTMQRADRDMRQVLQKLQELGAKPLGTQSVEETRKGPTPADAMTALLKDQGKTIPSPKVKKQDVTYQGAGGSQPARVYTPEGQAPQGGWPVIAYYHGGGWVIADIDTYDASATALAEKAKAIVVSVEYRHAPENKFPAAHEDSFAAYKWVLDNAQSWGGNPRKVAVAGESAGGNLAINMAMMARDQNVQLPVHMLLVYPVAGTDMNTPSYKENAEAMPLSKQAMEWFVKNTINGEQDLQDPRLDIVGKANLKNLPDATVITAEIDPLMSEGRMLAQKLRQAGSEVKYQNFDGAAHEFFGMAAAVKDAERAQDLAARELRDAFAETATGSTSRAGSNQPQR
jgi:acetyl esterase